MAGLVHSVDVDASTDRVRPYTRTGGRTTPSRALPPESLVCTRTYEEGPGQARTAEHRAICHLCRTPQSVAEVAAHLRLPLGTARVLLADLTDAGLVQIHHPTLDSDDRPTPDLLQRILAGLRRL